MDTRIKVPQDISEEPIYQRIIKEFLETSSVHKTAERTGMSEVRVRKVLLTEGLWSSDTSIRVQHYLDEGMNSSRIAEQLHTTVKAVQQYMPYSRGIYNGINRSNDAQYSAEYRERVRIAQERVVKRRQELSVKEGWNIEGAEAISKDANHSIGNPQISDPNKVNLNEGNPNKGDSNKGNPDIVHSNVIEVKEMREEGGHGMIMEPQDTFASDNNNEEAAGWNPEQYPGIVCFRRIPDGKLDDARIKCKGTDIVRLHLELLRNSISPFDYEDDGSEREPVKHVDYDEETRVLNSYGKVKYGETISRDILAPSDMPLYALHYTIQRLFGWQNSHLHRFHLPAKRFLEVTDDNAGKWSRLVGVLFRSPYMDEDDQFWADDYDGGSFKTWIKKKYTGPYLSLCHGEGIFQCSTDISEIKERYPLLKISYINYNGKLEIANVLPAEKGEKPGVLAVSPKEQEETWRGRIVKREILPFDRCSAQTMKFLFLEGGVDELLERLTIDDVLAMHERDPEDRLAEEEEILNSFEAFMDEDLKDDIEDILNRGLDYPHIQPIIGTPTDVLYYTYDFGDNWQIRITGSLDACDLIRQGRVTQDDLDNAICRVYETYRPVCIAADGMFLVDDAGGLGGFTRFLRAINPTAEKEYWGGGNEPDNWSYETKQDSLIWAKSLGWTDRLNLRTML